MDNAYQFARRFRQRFRRERNVPTAMPRGMTGAVTARSAVLAIVATGVLSAMSTAWAGAADDGEHRYPEITSPRALQPKIDFSGADAPPLRWRILPHEPGMPGSETAFPGAWTGSYAHRCPNYVEGSRIENINRMAAGGEPYVACKPH